MKMFEFWLKNPLKFVPNGPFNNISALIPIMAWRLQLNQWCLAYCRVYSSLGLNELKQLCMYYIDNISYILSTMKPGEINGLRSSNDCSK